VPRERRRRWALPERSLDGVVEAFPALRQSLLSDFDDCALSALFALEARGYTSSYQARGILFHRFAGKLLRTMRETGEVQIPVAEALAILAEACAQRDVPDEDVVWLPARERRLLRICVISLVTGKPFNMSRLVAVEERLRWIVTYPRPEGGLVRRELTGQPDAVVADPPDGVIVIDWKTTRKAPPPGPRRDEPKGDHWDDPEHLSYQGYFQQRLYGLLCLHRYPAADRVSLREFYPLEGVARYATVYRSDLGSLEDEFSALAEVLDRALAGGSRSAIWRPSPGVHCNYCPAPQRCPIEADVRAREGGIATPGEARRAAAEYVVAKQVSKRLHEALKGWVDLYGPVPVKAAKGRYEVRWKGQRGGGKVFGVHVPDASDRGPDDPALDRAFEEIAERAGRIS
jgi:hypothetical protein